MQEQFRLVTGAWVKLTEGMMGYAEGEEAVGERYSDYWWCRDDDSTVVEDNLDRLWWDMGGEG